MFSFLYSSFSLIITFYCCMFSVVERDFFGTSTRSDYRRIPGGFALSERVDQRPNISRKAVA